MSNKARSGTNPEHGSRSRLMLSDALRLSPCCGSWSCQTAAESARERFCHPSLPRGVMTATHFVAISAGGGDRTRKRTVRPPTWQVVLRISGGPTAPHYPEAPAPLRIRRSRPLNAEMRIRRRPEDRVSSRRPPGNHDDQRSCGERDASTGTSRDLDGQLSARAGCALDGTVRTDLRGTFGPPAGRLPLPAGWRFGRTPF
jgi:hypothetical protein